MEGAGQCGRDHFAFTGSPEPAESPVQSSSQQQGNRDTTRKHHLGDREARCDHRVGEGGLGKVPLPVAQWQWADSEQRYRMMTWWL